MLSSWRPRTRPREFPLAERSWSHDFRKGESTRNQLIDVTYNLIVALGVFRDGTLCCQWFVIIGRVAHLKTFINFENNNSLKFTSLALSNSSSESSTWSEPTPPSSSSSVSSTTWDQFKFIYDQSSNQPEEILGLQFVPCGLLRHLALCSPSDCRWCVINAFHPIFFSQSPVVWSVINDLGRGVDVVGWPCCWPPAEQHLRAGRRHPLLLLPFTSWLPCLWRFTSAKSIQLLCHPWKALHGAHLMMQLQSFKPRIARSGFLGHPSPARIPSQKCRVAKIQRHRHAWGGGGIVLPHTDLCFGLFLRHITCKQHMH